MSTDDDTPDGDDPRDQSEPEPRPTTDEIPRLEREPSGLEQLVSWLDKVETAVPQVLTDYLGMKTQEDGSIDLASFPGDRVKESAQVVVDSIVRSGTRLAQSASETFDSAAAGLAGEDDADQPASEPDPDDNVIDLDHERRRRQSPQATISDLGKTLRDAVKRYMDENVVSDDAAGDVDVQLDAEFLREHAGAMASTVLGALGRALQGAADGVQAAAAATAPDGRPAPAAASADAEEPEADSGADAAGAEAEAEGADDAAEPEDVLAAMDAVDAAHASDEAPRGGRDVNVKVNVDFGSLLGSLLGALNPPPSDDKR